MECEDQTPDVLHPRGRHDGHRRDGEHPEGPGQESRSPRISVDDGKVPRAGEMVGQPPSFRERPKKVAQGLKVSQVPIPVCSEQEGLKRGQEQQKNPTSVRFPRGKTKLRPEQPGTMLAQPSAFCSSQNPTFLIGHH